MTRCSPRAAIFPRLSCFCSSWISLREFACDQPVYRLLWEIYDETGALGLYGRAAERGAAAGQSAGVF